MPRYSLLMLAAAAVTFAADEPVNNLPDPYQTVTGWFHLPEGRTMGSTSAVDIDSKGHIWVAERCGKNSCAGSTLDPILEFDKDGKLLKSFGSGLFIFPHGICIDKDDNVWITDGQGRDGIGHQAIKFSPDGKVLMRLGKAGVAGKGEGEFIAPNDVAIAPNGDIFVSEGHTSGGRTPTNDRVQKFDKNGKFIMMWGKSGTGPAAFAGVRFERPAVRSRSQQQSHPDFRPERQVHSGVGAVQPTERHLHRQARQSVLGRFRIRFGIAQSSGLEARHPHRQREGRESGRLHSRSG